MERNKYSRILLKISGESLSGGGKGIDLEAVRWMAGEVKKVVEDGVEVALMVGGGNLVRGGREDYGISRVDADFLGMLGTLMNGIVLRGVMEKEGMDAEVLSAIGVDGIERYNPRKAKECLKQKKVVILTCGSGNPFFTTDTAAVLRALELEADCFIKGTKVSGVYDRDPERDENAKFFPELTYEEYLRLKLRVLDITSVSLAMEHNLPILVYNCTEPDALMRVVRGEPVGTIIKGGGNA